MFLTKNKILTYAISIKVNNDYFIYFFLEAVLHQFLKRINEYEICCKNFTNSE